MLEKYKWQLLMGLISAAVVFVPAAFIFGIFMALPNAYVYATASSFLTGFFWWHMLCARKGACSPLRGGLAGALTGVIFQFLWTMILNLVTLFQGDFETLGQWVANTWSGMVLTFLAVFWTAVIFVPCLAVAGAILGSAQRKAVQGSPINSTEELIG